MTGEPPVAHQPMAMETWNGSKDMAACKTWNEISPLFEPGSEARALTFLLEVSNDSWQKTSEQIKMGDVCVNTCAQSYGLYCSTGEVHRESP